MSTTNRTETSPSPLLPRRELLSTLGVGAMAGLAMSTGAFAQQPKEMPVQIAPAPMSPEAMGWDAKAGQYVLPALPYKYEDLEPNIDAETMHLHHDKHHKAYVEGLNKAVAMLAEIRAGKRDASETKAWSRELAFNGSGHFLHVLYWNCMTPKGGGEPEGALAERITKDFGSYKAFADQFKAAATGVEGGGWAILVYEPTAQTLMIMQAEKHQNLTAWSVVPLLPCDVWEHAYYLKYKNVRKDYVAAFMNVINWDAVDKNLAHATRA